MRRPEGGRLVSKKSGSPEVQKSRSPVITISRNAKGVSVVAGLVPATIRKGNVYGSPVITISGNAKGISVVAGLVPATIHLDNISVYRSKEVK